ncbi:MAG TPA: TetR/AcrR family transcriptional regulator, partial [Sphingomonas sp.]
GDHWHKIASAAAALVEYQMSERGPLLRSSALSALPEAMRLKMVERANRVSERFAAMISDGVADGSIRAVDPEIGGHAIMAAIDAAATLRRWAVQRPLDDAVADFSVALRCGIFPA